MKLLDEQLAYYRARAPEYDTDVRWMKSFVRKVARRLGPARRVGTALELACGTGLWTRMLLSRADHVTAVDGSPEMLRIARARAGSGRVRYRRADLFRWTPAESYDLVFFANWLSHVPPRKLRRFLRTVRGAVRPGGRLLIVDQDSRTTALGALDPTEVRSSRSLHDGREFAIVKVFYDLAHLRDVLGALGFRVTIAKVGRVYFLLSAVRPLPRAPGRSAEGRVSSARRRKK